MANGGQDLFIWHLVCRLPRQHIKIRSPQILYLSLARPRVLLLASSSLRGNFCKIQPCKPIWAGSWWTIRSHHWTLGSLSCWVAILDGLSTTNRFEVVIMTLQTCKVACIIHTILIVHFFICMWLYMLCVILYLFIYIVCVCKLMVLQGRYTGNY